MTDLRGWITDTELSPRFPYYTRANADEVGPEPFSPLGWSLGWVKGCIPGVARGFIEFGVLTAEEFALDPPEVFGNWGGYFFNQLSLPRMMGVRMPGASPEAIDQAYFGDHPGVPPYTPHPDDDDADRSARLGETMAWVMSSSGFEAQEAWAERARAAVRDRPDLGALGNAELVARARQLAGPDLEEAWTPYCQSVLGASLGPGAVQAICAGIGRAADAAALLSAVGDIESAEAPMLMWDLSRLVRSSPALTAEFDRGVAGLLDRLAPSADGGGGGDGDAARFLAGWEDLLARHGHRGPNEWDLRAHSWTTDPALPLGMLDRMRHQDDTRSPAEANAAAAAERERLSAELLALVEGDAEAHGGLQAGIASAAVFFRLREQGKNACIRLLHEAKLALLEVGRRLVVDGVIDEPRQVFMVLDDELDAFLADPAAMSATIRDRDRDFAVLATLEPPYIVKREDGVPPISSWSVRGSAPAEPVAAGDTLQGAMGAPGVARGTARVILDPGNPGAFGPGDIMIAPTTDPSWVPLFLAAEAVVVDVGAVGSHAAIVCRELGLPCAVSVIDATRRIPDGATVEVDGATGTVTVLSVP